MHGFGFQALLFNGRAKLHPPNKHIRKPLPLSIGNDENMQDDDSQEWRCDLLSSCQHETQQTLGGIDVYTACVQLVSACHYT